jgi:predicted TIM-barrel fold metal-dependent hydrolase
MEESPMKAGRFVVDTHVHAQRFAAGPALRQRGVDVTRARYDDLGQLIRELEPYDNSPRLLYDMQCYGVDMCVLLPAFGMTNELNVQLVERYPDKFVAFCNASETAARARRGEIEWTGEAAAAEIDRLLATGKFVGVGEGMPANALNRRTLSQTERLDQMRPIMEVVRRHGVVASVHTGLVMGYTASYHYWPETLHPLWVHDLAAEYPDVPIILNHGGIQGWWTERFWEECLNVAAAHDNVYLETGLWWTELYHKPLRDPNIGPEKLLWGTDWGASIPFVNQPGHYPPSYAVQLRKQGLVRHQVDVWGWSLRQLLALNISQDDLNLILGGNAVRLFKLPVPHTRLFREDVAPGPALPRIAGGAQDAGPWLGAAELDLPPRCC